MGKLKPCPDCNHEVSKKAKACPNCGRSLKSEPRGGCSTILIFLVLPLAFVSYCTTQMDESNNNSATPKSVSSQAEKKEEYNNIFYIKHDTDGPKGATRVKGYFTSERDKEKLKEHCKKQYGGFTVCFYYKNKQNLVHLGSLKPFEGIKRAEKTEYFMRVDISVDGKNITTKNK